MTILSKTSFLLSSGIRSVIRDCVDGEDGLPELGVLIRAMTRAGLSTASTRS